MNLLLPVSVDTVGFTCFFADSAPFLGLLTVSGASVKCLQTGWEGFLGGEERGLFWTSQPAAGMSQRSTGHTAKKEPVIRREVLDFWARQSLGGRGIVCHVRFTHDGRDVL